MSWDAISAISQLVGSVAVVFSVLYLAVQVHRSTRVAKVAAQDAAAAAVRDVTNTFMDNAEMARIWRIGLENLNSLPVDDQARFFHGTHQFLKALETIHFHHVNGLMDEQIWAGWQELLCHYIASPGIRHYWNLRNKLFSERFRNYVASMSTPDDPRTVGGLSAGQKETG